MQGDFTDAFKLAERGDVIYHDPPYVDLTAAPTFTKYTAEGFPRERQQELADLARATAARGISVVISNHLTGETRALSRSTSPVGTYDGTSTLGSDSFRLVLALDSSPLAGP